MKTKATKTFTTPHEAARTKATKKVNKSKPAGRDAWNARSNSRMSRINAVVIAAGKAGVTTAQVAKESKETAGLVSAQLVYHLAKKNCSRKTETNGDGAKVTRWFPKIS